MNICIHKRILGTTQHLSTNFESKSSWVEDPDSEDLTIGFKNNETINIVSFLLNKKIPDSPDKKFALPFRHSSLENILWSHVLPKKEYRKYFQSIQNAIGETLKSDQYEYFNNRISIQQKLISFLEPSKIDEKVFGKYCADPELVNKSVLTTFAPKKGFAKNVDYNLVGTNTGRLTILAGPQILTLKKELRNILTSRFEGGKIIQFDYTSLEPRVALMLSGKNPERDIYTSLCKQVLGGKYGRQTAKLLTIATLYGMGINRVKDLLGVSKITAREVLDQLEDFFGVEDIKKQLEKEAESGFIKNYFGRNIRVRNNASHVLYNNYIQSTAMDAALEGFFKVVQNIKREKYQCIPIFVLHDAIIFDCHPECFDKLEVIMNPGQNLSSFESQLYMEAEEV